VIDSNARLAPGVLQSDKAARVPLPIICRQSRIFAETTPVLTIPARQPCDLRMMPMLFYLRWRADLLSLDRRDDRKNPARALSLREDKSR